MPLSKRSSGGEGRTPLTLSFNPSPLPTRSAGLSSSSFMSPPPPPPSSSSFPKPSSSSFLPPASTTGLGLSTSLPPNTTATISSSIPKTQNDFSKFSSALASPTTTTTGGLGSSLPPTTTSTALGSSLPHRSTTNDDESILLNNSVSLSCISPNHKIVHSLSTSSPLSSSDAQQEGEDSLYIISSILPLQSSQHSNNSNDRDEKKESDTTTEEEEIKTIVTLLPKHVVDACKIDSPLGLICVDNDDDFSPSSFSSSSYSSQHQQQMKKKELPWLCLYTSKAAFLLQISYSPSSPSSYSSSSYSNKIVEGMVMNCNEPFEEYLLGTTSSTSHISIIKIRPAPTSNKGDLICSPCSMAMLTNEYALVLRHGEKEGGGFVTTPLQFSQEELMGENEEEEEGFVDFCFMGPSSSSSLSIFSMLSILLLKSNGTVHGASPILFDKCIISTQVVQNGMEYLDGEIARLQTLKEEEKNGEVEARYRMCRAGKQFLLDAFGPTITGNEGGGRSPYYVTSYMNSGNSKNVSASATLWPVQLQGPLLLPNNNTQDEYGGDKAVVIEPFGSSASSSTSGGKGVVDGIVIASASSSSSSSSQTNKLSFGIFPAGMTTLLPRFAFETFDDQSMLDEGIYNCGHIVECVQLEEEEGAEEEEEYHPSRPSRRRGGRKGKECAIVTDPVKNDMVHYTSSKGVFTVTTNVLSVYAHKITQEVDGNAAPAPSFSSPLGRKKEMEVRTNAWSCLEVSGGSGFAASEGYDRYGNYSSGGVALSGVVVSGDAHLGHVLVASLSNGTMEAVNITAAQYLHEASALDASTALSAAAQKQQQPINKAMLESDEALKVMQSIQPLHEILKPLMNQVVTGLSTMGKIVGGQTKPSAANASSIATFISTKEKCEKDVILPLQEMNQLSSARMNMLKDMHAHQKQQLQQLQSMIDTLKTRMKVTSDKKIIAETNATSLVQRSSAVLSASRDLLPTITDAEREYFSQLKRYEMNAHKWEGMAEEVQSKCTTLCDSLDPSTSSCKVNLDQQHLSQCFDLLEAQGKLLKKHGKKMDKVEGMMKEMVVASGYGDEEDEEGKGQEETLAITDGR